MSTLILDDIKGSELPEAWARKIKARPNEGFTVTIQPETEQREAARKLEEIMRSVSREAQARGMTPEILEEIHNS